MVSNFWTGCFASVMSLVVMGCSGTGISSVSPVEPSLMDFEQFRAAARDGVVRTVIVGDAFNGNTEQVAQVVNGAFATVHVGTPAEFRSNLEAKDVRDPRIVVLFSPSKGFGPSSICRDDKNLSAVSEAPGPDRLRAMAAFCVGHTLRTWTVVQSPAPKSSDDPVLHQVAQRMAFDIFPSRSSKSPGDCLNNC